VVVEGDVAAAGDVVAEQPEIPITAPLTAAAAMDMVSLRLLEILCLKAMGGSSLTS
jgi:hypothetical protein